MPTNEIRRIVEPSLAKLISADDPVRPKIPYQWRIEPSQRFYYLGVRAHDNPQSRFYVKPYYEAAICISHMNSIPTSEMDMVYRIHSGNIAVAYTVWSKAKGAGRKILLDLLEQYKYNNDMKRFVTLSPKTEMAMKFHLSNGAKLLYENLTTNNFEYDLT
tara:strand:- start:9033 stop:9512 length:480 start_codon:yes stop_codon:yes gene_type:complete